MTADGVSLASEANKLAVLKQQEEHLVNFLNEGIDMGKKLHKAKSELAVIYERLIESVAWRYALSINDSEHYSINGMPNIYFGSLCCKFFREGDVAVLNKDG